MTAEDVLDLLLGAGIAVMVEGGRLRLEAPRGVLTPEIRAVVGEHRAALLEMLGPPSSGAELRVKLDDLHDFCQGRGLRLVGLRWPDQGGAPAGVFEPIDMGEQGDLPPL